MTTTGFLIVGCVISGAIFFTVGGFLIGLSVGRLLNNKNQESNP